MDYITTVGRCFIAGNFTIEHKEEKKNDFTLTNQTYASYVDSEYGPYTSLMNYSRNFLPAIKAQDANGIIAIKPKSIPIETNADGEFVVSSVDLPEPLPYYYSIKELVGYVDGEYAFVELQEKSVVLDTENNQVKEGFVYELYDDTWIYKVIQIGKKADQRYEIVNWFEHGCDYVPVEKLMGIGTISYNQIIYQPQFLLATANLENAILHQSYLDMINAKIVFPMFSVISSDCEFEIITDGLNASCQGGSVSGQYSDGREYIRQCTQCSGTGLVNRIGPFGEIRVSPGDWEEKGDASMPDAIKYYSPPLESPQFLVEQKDSELSKARGILHLNTTMGQAKGNADATATAKALDLKNLISFVAPIGAQTWQIIRFMYKTTGIQRYKNSFVESEIVEPREYDFKTQSDYLADLKEAEDMPAPIKLELIRQYIKSAFHGENDSIKVLTLLTEADLLLTATQEDIDMGVAAGNIAQWQVVLHRSARALIEALLAENPEFLDQEKRVQVEQLQAKAKEAEASIETPENTVAA